MCLICLLGLVDSEVWWNADPCWTTASRTVWSSFQNEHVSWVCIDRRLNANAFVRVCISDDKSGGLLRLHSTYRHDLKIYSSDEGRVQTSAAAFTKGLLDLEGTSLTPILVSLLQKVPGCVSVGSFKSSQDTGMLDSFDKGASEGIQQSKAELYNRMTWNKEKEYSLQSPSRMFEYHSRVDA